MLGGEQERTLNLCSLRAPGLSRSIPGRDVPSDGGPLPPGPVISQGDQEGAEVEALPGQSWPKGQVKRHFLLPPKGAVRSLEALSYNLSGRREAEM